MTDTKKIIVRLRPNAKQNKIIGWQEDPEGARVLKVQVTTIPEKGKANKALIALLAKEWKIPKTSITLIRGETERTKTLEIPSNTNI